MPGIKAEFGELTFVRTFQAPRELVFRCMTEPEHLTHFWGPTGVSTPLDQIVIEPRAGGIFRTVMVNDADGSQHPSEGVYLEVTPPQRLSWREASIGMVTTTDFVDLGDGRTEVRIHQTNVPEFIMNPQAQAGFETSLDKCAAYVAALATA